MVSATDRSHDDNWRGGYYELALKLGPSDDGRLGLAASSLWRAAGLGAPFRRGRPVRGGVPVELTAETLLTGPVRAVAPIPGLGSTLCLAIVVREESGDGGRARTGADWLDLCLPLGALGNLDPRVGAYPFDDTEASRVWREPVESWFESVARAVFAEVGFEHAVTGFEVSGTEPHEARAGYVAVYRSHGGSLRVDPIRHW